MSCFIQFDTPSRDENYHQHKITSLEELWSGYDIIQIIYNLCTQTANKQVRVIEEIENHK